MKRRFIRGCISIILLTLLLVSCNSDKDNAGNTTEATSDTTVDENIFETEFSEPPAEAMTEHKEEPNTDIVGNNGDFLRSFYGENTGTDKTYTGLEPIEKIDFSAVKFRNSEAFSSEMISHSYGVATEEKPHTISINNQRFFDDKLLDAVCYDSKNEEKVLYLTFDCGYENGYTAKILDVLKEKNVSAAFFCTLPQMKENPELIARMINEGHIVGNHSVTHPDFSQLSQSEIVEEIKGFDDYIRENFGYSSLYFRFPEGKYSERVVSVINDLGYRCVFWSLAYADWDTENQKGAMYAYETVLARLHPGAVILLHSVSSDNANALADIIDTARSRGYEFRSLEEM